MLAIENNSFNYSLIVTSAFVFILIIDWPNLLMYQINFRQTWYWQQNHPWIILIWYDVQIVCIIGKWWQYFVEHKLVALRMNVGEFQELI